MMRKNFSRPFEQIRSAQPKPSSRPSQARTIPSEFLSELQSAASMIMSRAECEELERELQMLRRPRIVAA
jgi:hypothetical protein